MKVFFAILVFVVCSSLMYAQGYWKMVVDGTQYNISGFSAVENSMVMCGYKFMKEGNKYIVRSYISQSNDDGATWKHIMKSASDSARTDLSTYFAFNNVFIQDRNNIMALAFHGANDTSFRFVTSDGGANWSISPVFDDAGEIVHIVRYHMTTSKYGCISDLRGKGYRIEDSGKTIRQLKGFDSKSLQMIDIQRPNDSTFFILSGAQNPEKLLTVSTDNGNTWNNYQMPENVGSMCFVDKDHGFIIQSLLDSTDTPNTETLYRTDDGGKTLTLAYYNNTPDRGCLNNIFSTGTNRYTMIARKHIYYSIDGGESWGEDSIIADRIKLLEGDFYKVNDSTMYFQESLGAVWKYHPGKYTSVEEQTAPTPLLAVPTPFTDEARIEFDVEQAGAVSVLVRNSMGELVAQREYYSQSGRQSFSLAGAELPAGIYFCDIVANGKTYRAKAVLVR